MQKEQLEKTKVKIEKLISVTKEQVDVAGKAIEIQAILERRETRYKLQVELNNIKSKAKDIDSTISLVEKSSINRHCSYYIRNNKQIKKNIINPEFIDAIKKDKLDTWNTHYFDLNYKTLDRKTKYYSFSTMFDFDKTKFSMFCSNYLLNLNHASFEEGIKVNVQKTFALIENFHKGKSYLIWVNPKLKNDDTRPLFEKNKDIRKERYSLSKMSSVENISTGTLSAKQILKSSDKEPIEHEVDGKNALTWVKNFSKEGDSYIFLLLTTVYIDDLKNNMDSSFWKILPAALVALVLSIFSGFFIFKRLLKSINILSQTAREVNLGNRTIRSNVKGNDDIGSLGIAFDSMLDSLQDNIKTLDFQVEEKTKELTSSLKDKDELLEEKEILLKEIHHRVKNNLALTVGLIKLQQNEIKDKKSKKVLKDIQERIYTMELLHRKLHESTNLNQIDFKEYVLSLLKDIELTYNMKNKVSMIVNIEEVFLNIERAMPCGLILNELITNSFKYAFDDKKNAKLKISMKLIDGKYVLKVKDNGKGISENIDIHSSNTLGLRLINSIAKIQLKGKLKYKNKKGSFFKIVF